MVAKPRPVVVLVDDSPSMRTVFERGTSVLEDAEVKIFDSVSASWSYLEQNRPDLLFLNIKMPGVDGLTFLKDLRQLALHKDTRVVMISSKDYAQDRTVASELGALEFITKPTPIRVISDVVLKYLKADPA
ncbi:MAG: response regulator [Gammaproteobacteria bacterium]|nr:response regulator [Gammaproteobacteria bacterium]